MDEKHGKLMHASGNANCNSSFRSCVPGGNNDKEEIPIFRQNQAFTVFVILDVAALVFSTTSILIFLSMLTSRYAENDFLV